MGPCCALAEAVCHREWCVVQRCRRHVARWKDMLRGYKIKMPRGGDYAPYPAEFTWRTSQVSEARWDPAALPISQCIGGPWSQRHSCETHGPQEFCQTCSTLFLPHFAVRTATKRNNFHVRTPDTSLVDSDTPSFKIDAIQHIPDEEV